MPCTAQYMRNIFSNNITPLDPDKYTPSVLAPELADIIGHFLEQMEIEDAREEHKKKFSKILRDVLWGVLRVRTTVVSNRVDFICDFLLEV
jgi:uncharacterized protein (DUF1919 family)